MFIAAWLFFLSGTILLSTSVDVTYKSYMTAFLLESLIVASGFLAN